MAIDWALAADVAKGIVLVLVGVVATRFIQRRPRLIAFYGHVGEFRLAPPTATAPAFPVHTHTVIIRNAGSLPAHNVRVPHRGALAVANIHVSVDPGVNHQVNTLPGGQEELLFPVLAPKQQVTVSYLYFPPITWSVINLPISSDEGMAKQVTILPTVQLPRWLIVILWTLIAFGIAALAYIFLELYRWASGLG